MGRERVVEALKWNPKEKMKVENEEKGRKRGEQGLECAAECVWDVCVLQRKRAKYDAVFDLCV